MRLPIRTRLALIFAGLMAVTLLPTGIFIYSSVRGDLWGPVEQRLNDRSRELIADLEESPGELDEDDDDEPEAGFAQIVSPEGNVLDFTANGPDRRLLSGAQLDAIGSGAFFEVHTARGDDDDEAMLFARPAPGGSIALVGSRFVGPHELLERLALLLWAGGLGLLGLTSWVAWLVAGAALAPVERMRSEVSAISAGEPGRRLRVPQTGDEVARLAETLNAMLERIEAAAERQRRLVDDASHELRTPLGILKTELELALRRARSPTELKAALSSAAEESDHLNRLADDLLVLARADRAALPVRRTETDLASLVGELTDLYATRASERGVTMDGRGNGSVMARVDPVRLRQALGNLLDNSLRHTPAGGVIEIELTPTDHSVDITVADTGEGFPSDFAGKAFEPFARGDYARTRSEGGVGLGLAIVRAIVEAHGGETTARNLPGGGAEVVLRLPVREPSPS